MPVRISSVFYLFAFIQSLHNSLSYFSFIEGQVNEFATILLGSRDKAIRWILTDPSQFDVLTLFIVGTLFYFLTISTFGSSLPLGVFTPTVLIGACT